MNLNITRFTQVCVDGHGWVSSLVKSALGRPVHFDSRNLATPPWICVDLRDADVVPWLNTSLRHIIITTAFSCQDFSLLIWFLWTEEGKHFQGRIIQDFVIYWRVPKEIPLLDRLSLSGVDYFVWHIILALDIWLPGHWRAILQTQVTHYNDSFTKHFVFISSIDCIIPQVYLHAISRFNWNLKVSKQQHKKVIIDYSKLIIMNE